MFGFLEDSFIEEIDEALEVVVGVTKDDINENDKSKNPKMNYMMSPLTF